MGIPSSLHQRLIAALLRYEPFESDKVLRAVFVDEWISQWAADLPEARSKNERVQTVIEYLSDKRNRNGENALVLFLRVLRERTPSDDDRYQELATLADELAAAVRPPPPPPPPTLPTLPWKLIAIIAGVATLVLIGIIVWSILTPTPCFVCYKIDVQVDGTTDTEVKITIATNGKAPLDYTAHANGVAEICIPCEYVGRSGSLTVGASGYHTYQQDLVLGEEKLPGRISLVSVSDTPIPIPALDSCMKEEKNGNGGTDIITLPGDECYGNRIQIDLLVRGTTFGFSFWEVQAYGLDDPEMQNPLITKEDIACASSTEDDNLAYYHPGKAIDTDLSSRWSSYWDEPECFVIMLSEPKYIKSIVVTWQDAFALKYRVTVSNKDEECPYELP